MLDSRQLNFRSQNLSPLVSRSVTCSIAAGKGSTATTHSINNDNHHLSSDVRLEICSSTRHFNAENPLKLIGTVGRVIGMLYV